MRILKIGLLSAVCLASLALAAEKEPSPEARANPAADEIAVLRQQLADQQSQIAALRAAMEEQKRLFERVLVTLPGRPSAAPLTLVSGHPDEALAAAPEAAVSSTSAAMRAPQAGVPDAPAFGAVGWEAGGGAEPAVSPLQFHIGSAYITPVGFMDFTSVWRSKDNGSGIGTNFAGIPYGNVFQNRLSEFRLSMQNSRIGFRVDALVKGAHVLGYMESDFVGNNPGNVAVSSNSNTLRGRLYWVDVRKNQWEVLGGQTWSLITPGRTGISALPGNLFYTQNIDVNYQLGLVWGRIPELRFVYHPSSKVALAIALDSPEQYAGGSAGGSLVTFPAALSSTYLGGELNNGSTTLNVPNVAPDVIAKLALDPSSKLHFEVGGVERNFKLWNPNTNIHFTAAGGGGFINLNAELFKGFRLLANTYWSDGGGRYIFGQAPDLIARVDGSPSLVHAGSTVDGFEYTHKNTLLYAYYGGLYAGRNVTLDTNGKPVGYGYTGSPAGQNRNVHEVTFGFTETFWKDSKYGALALMGQYSYVLRHPWFVATGSPKDAHLNMVFMNLRYTLPGSGPAFGVARASRP